MQTFLPYADFEQSAAVLDRARLGKQRVECLQLLKGQWANHSTSKMWRDSEFHLATYAQVVCIEWRRRGYKDTVLDKIAELVKSRPLGADFPIWFGDPDFHLAHQSNLVRKNPEYYRKYFPEVPDNLPYIWPKKPPLQSTLTPKGALSENP